MVFIVDTYGSEPSSPAERNPRLTRPGPLAAPIRPYRPLAVNHLPIRLALREIGALAILPKNRVSYGGDDVVG